MSLKEITKEAKIDIRYCVSCYMKNLFLLSPNLKSSLGFLIYS